MILITEMMDEAAVDTLARKFQVTYSPGLDGRRELALEEARTARALIVRNRTIVDAEMLGAAPGLECVGRLGVGLDNIDVEECAKRGVEVFPATGANDQSVAEYVLCAAMMLLRGAYGQGASVASGDWPRMQCVGRETAGKTLGVIGLGSTGRRTAELARVVGMQTVGFDPYLDSSADAWEQTERLGLNQVLAVSDVITAHVPLTRDTMHLLDRKRLSAAKRGAILINAARGGVVDERAVVDLLKVGRLGGAALDVFETEPVTAASGLRFSGLGNLLLTPHIAGVTKESNVRVSAMIAEKVIAHLERNGDS